MINSQKAFKILKEEGCSSEVIEHIKAVRDISVEIAKKIKENGHEVNVQKVKLGAIFHDIGRSVTHDISHGIKGAKILKERELDEFVPFAENHLGAGITKKEAEKLGLPEKNYTPQSLEEKIVAYGDNLIDGKKIQSSKEALNELKEDLGKNHESIKRFKELHSQLKELGGIGEEI